ncbi:hypothetical protein VOLCADRAFT_107439 [Volvox carteri f. nagariensis]|uniref:Uncharacterized protein n=1 Tax=Volvox carteri f. nagariensis TaxID=3068 RepID=D8UE10_VOLCA|nr:uncharacterized protein VOLCADRAFT_107439 [Volvox carteri f. nagariensis]EFJ42008.1 hypothetical protein VOLCADRAFT_107439 [Volvox carteri f. nagariensis]|eukprot:XP_002956883.1 hypothetical protein VOLCADRAFT_107439 [Volvox carteri f. nagariensis]
MADRGRKAFPVSSHLCDERWQRHCMDLHKQRLVDMKHRIDNTKPETFDLVLSKGKRQMLDKERQTEVDRENAILLQKMVRIKEQDTRAVFRPWTARSTFQWKVGHYYDPATNTKTLDHINLTSSVSPRSIHYFALTRPGTAPPDVTARLRDMEIQVDNTKLLRAITTMRTHYSNEVFERRHAEESILVNRISNFRGPESASISAARNTPYLAPLTGRSSSSNRGSRQAPRMGWPAAPTSPSQPRYEEGQDRDGIHLPSLSCGNSRPGTAVGGTQEGLGATSPRESASSHRNGSSRQSGSSRHSLSSRHSGGSLGGEAPQAQPSAGPVVGSRPGSTHAGGSAAGSQSTSTMAGASFSFAGKREDGRKGSASSEGLKPSSSTSSSSSKRSVGGGAGAVDPGTSVEDEYADEQYEQEDQDEKRREDEEEAAQSDRSGSKSSSGSAVRAQDRREDAGNSGYDDEDFAADDDTNRVSGAVEEDDAYTEPTPRDDGDSDEGAGGGVRKGPAGGDDERPAEDGLEDQDAGEEAEAFDSAEAELRAEMKAKEEAEMNQQFADEMAADAYDDYGMGGGAGSSIGAASYNTAQSPKVGGFAADWD